MKIFILTNPLRITLIKQVRNRVFEQVDNFICRDWLYNTKFLFSTAIIESVKPGVKAAVVNLDIFYNNL